MTARDHADLVRGCLFGGAVGDGFGYAVEFDSLPAIRATFGADGITEPVTRDGRLVVSDDTQMTLFTLEGLLRAGADPDQAVAEIRLAYLDWYATQSGSGPDWNPAGELCSEASLRVCRAPGNTCMSALEAGGWGTRGEPINDSKGCGGVMRVAPIGLVRAWSAETAFEVAGRAAAITHGHPTGYLSSGAMAMMIRLAVGGEKLPRAAETAMATAAASSRGGETAAAIGQALDTARARPRDHPAAVAKLGAGWIGEEALAIGLYAALAGGSFAEVLAIAANHDGDSDSTASIAGQLRGAFEGLSDLPDAWTRRLDVHRPMTRQIAAFLDI